MSRRPRCQKVHQQERDVVQNVGGGETLVELKGIEEGRHAVDQAHVAQMQVAVAAPHVAVRTAAIEERCERLDGRLRAPAKLVDLGRIERPAGRCGQQLCILGRELGYRGRRGRLSPHRGSRMRRGDGIGGAIDAVCDKLAARGERIERRVVVEAAHMHQPVDDRALAAQPQRAAGGTRHRNHAEVNLRCERAVHSQFGQCRGVAFLNSGEVEIRVAHRPLQLECIAARQKHDGGVGVEALDGPTRVRGGIREERDDLGL